jgi:hypothetical protein
VQNKKKHHISFEEAQYTFSDPGRIILSAPAIGVNVLLLPEELIPKEETKKVTISLSKRNIDFFERVPKETHIPYQ